MKNSAFLFTTILLLISFNSNAQQKQTKRFLIRSVAVNNSFQNFGTTFFGKNKIIYSSQNKKNAFLNLYIGVIDKNGEITNSKKLDGPNTKYNESNVVFSKDQKTVYFSRSILGQQNTIKKERDRNGTIAIFKATVTSLGKWTNITPLPFNDPSYDVGHPALSNDGTKMYFTSNMPGTIGLTDIFVVTINNEGSFGVPKNMGPKVNSEYKEMFPYIDDNDILFFSSKRPDEGYGGLDIYAVQRYENGDISERLHLEPPINSMGDDFNYIFNQKEKSGYFSSNRSTSKGSDDIYFLKETRPLLFDCFQEINGVVIDEQSQKPIPYATVTLKDASGKELEKITTKKDGKFSFRHTVCDTDYELLGEKKHYAQDVKQFITKSVNKGETLITIHLSDDFIVRRRGKRMLDINVINFDFNSAKIRPDAANQLDRVLNTMNRYPRMVIELGTHTDSRGKNLYNLVLSSKRAKSVIHYIIDHGINESRISGRGYGEKRLLNKCKDGIKCTEKEHELNRRSEFVITKM